MLESGLTFSSSTINLNLDATTNGKMITTNGDIIPNLYIQGASGGWTLQDDLTIAGRFYQNNGTFNANNYNITANDFYFNADTDLIPTVIMGSGTWEATGNDSTYSTTWYIYQNNSEVVTITPGTSTIKFTDTSANYKTFGFIDNTATQTGKTYNNIWFAGGGTGPVIIQGSNTFNDFKIDAGKTVYFTDDTTQTVNTFTANGSAGNLITLNGSSTDGWNISAPSGTITSNYLDLSYSNAIGGATWYAGSHSNNTTSNSGWIFSSPATLPTNIVTDSRIQILVSWIASSEDNSYYVENVTAGTNSGWITGTSWVSSGLTCGTNYSFRIKSKNSIGTETDFSSESTSSTVSCSTTTTSSSGGSSGGFHLSPPTIPTVIPGCDSRTTGFSTTTGQSCVNNISTPSTTPTIIPGCDSRTTGFSTVTGQSCMNNSASGVITTIQSYNFGTTILKNGSRGEAVKELQRFLNAKLNLGLIVDGILGPKTIVVIKQWQKDNGLVADGLIGPKTKVKMNAVAQ
jgi:dihydrofolate reductase